MAADDIAVSNVIVVAMKAQTTTGTPESLSASDANVVVTECEILPDHNIADERLDTNSDGTEKVVAAGQTCRVTLTTELGGSGNTSNLPAWATALLPATGWEKGTSNVFTYSADSDSIATICKWTDDVKQTASDLRGTHTIVYNAGVPAKITFNLVGNYSDEADDTNPDANPPDNLPPIWANNAVTAKVGTNSAYALAVSTMTISSGTGSFMRPDPNAASGFASGCIAGKRVSTVSMDPERAKALTTKDWHTVQKTSEECVLSVACGDTANNIVTVVGSRMQVTQGPPGDRNGIAIRNISGRFNGASPYTIAFS